MVIPTKTQEVFRIAQLTDVHLTNFPLSKNDQEILKDIEKGLNWVQPDLIMVTGDFINSYQNESEKEIVKVFLNF